MEVPQKHPLCLRAAPSFRPPAFNQSDSIATEELRPGYLRLKTNTKTPRWLIYSESNLPTWLARYRDYQLPTANYQPLKIYTANYIYQAVFMPKGENEIIFEYPGLFRQMKYAVRDLMF